MNFLDKLVLITGGSSGIGKQIAADCLRAGARVIIVSNVAERLEQASQELSVISPKVFAVECDVGDTASVLRMRDKVLANYGCPDILINNAGFATYRTIEATDLAEVEQIVNVNLVGAMRCTKAFLDKFVERRSGVIVNIASIAGRIALTPNGTYCAAKFGMAAWSEVLKYELAPFNIQINLVCPGRVETPFFDHETFKTRISGVETRHLITVEDVSRATLKAIQRNHFVTYIPKIYAVVAWLLNTFPLVLRPIYGQFIILRVKAFYKNK